MIKAWFFEKKFAQLLRDRRPVKVDRINTINSVTIVCDERQYTSQQMLEASGYFEVMDIRTRCYLITSKKIELAPTGVEWITPEECNWFGVPSESSLVQWLMQKPDLLIVINGMNHPTIAYLTAVSNSKLIAVIGGDREFSIGQFFLDPKDATGLSLNQLCAKLYGMLLHIGMKTPILG